MPNERSTSATPVTSQEITEALQSLRDGILADVRTTVLTETTRIASLTPPTSRGEFGWRMLLGIRDFFSSGIFFVILGAALLYIAHNLLVEGRAQSGFSFVLVVLGIAIMLYGTGTQGVGKIEGDAATIGKYNAAIAGGAGLLTFCIAWGIVKYSENMKTAFQIEQKYLRIPVVTTDKTPLLDWYMWEFSIDGIGIPASRRGKTIEVIIPYHMSEFGVRKGADQQKRDDMLERCLDATSKGSDNFFTRNIRASFQLLQESKSEYNGGVLGPKGTQEIPVVIESSNTQGFDGGLDYPKYPRSLCIDLKSTARADKDSNVAGNRVVDPHATMTQVKPSEPAFIPTQGSQ